MNNFFLVLLLLSLAGLIAGLANPQLFKLPSRKVAGPVFGGAAILFFILFGITNPPTSQSVATTSPVNTAPQKVAIIAMPVICKSNCLSDAQYLHSIETDVLPSLKKAQQQYMSEVPTWVIWNEAGTDVATSDWQGATIGLTQVQKTLLPLATKAPSDFTQANNLLSQAVSNQLNGANMVDGAIKAALAQSNNQGDFFYVDPDSTEAGITSIDQGFTDEIHSLDLIASSLLLSPAQVSTLKEMEQELKNQQIVDLQMMVESYYKVEQTLKNGIQNDVASIGGGIQAKYSGIEIGPTDSGGSLSITIFVNVGNFINKNVFLNTTNLLSSQLFQSVFSASSTSNMNISDVNIYYTGATTDEYGNQYANTAMLQYGMSYLTYQKINWSGFNQSTLCDVLQQGTENGNGCNVLVKL